MLPDTPDPAPLVGRHDREESASAAGGLASAAVLLAAAVATGIDGLTLVLLTAGMTALQWLDREPDEALELRDRARPLPPGARQRRWGGAALVLARVAGFGVPLVGLFVAAAAEWDSARWLLPIGAGTFLGLSLRTALRVARLRRRQQREGLVLLVGERPSRREPRPSFTAPTGGGSGALGGCSPPGEERRAR